MANVEINDLTNKATGESTDEFEIQETGGGSSRKMPMSGVRITRSQVTDYPAAYGEIKEDNDSGTAITLTTAGTFYGWVSAADGELDATYVTSDTADVTADHLTVGSGGDGKFIVQAQATAQISASRTIEMRVYNTGVESHVGCEHANTAVSAKKFSLSCHGILDLSNGDEISLRFTSDQNSDSITVYRVQLAIVRI